eukprot:11772799-Ditylum_brightwellii.AAC.1
MLVDNFLRLKRLINPVQLAKGKNLVELACVNDEENDDSTFFFEQDFHDLMTQWKIVLLESMLNETVNWFHQGLWHPSHDCLSLPEKQDFRQRIWCATGKGNANSIVGRSNHRFNCHWKVK